MSRANRQTVQANIPKAATSSTAKRTRVIAAYGNAASGVCYKRRMPLNQELIDILACPKCKGALKLRDDQSAFECGNCKLAYAVIDEIPNFIIEEAQPLK